MIETTNLYEILAQVADEVATQGGGDIRLPDGTSSERYTPLAEGMAPLAAIAALTGNLNWSQVAGLGFFQAMSCEDPRELRFELVKHVASLVAWVNDIDNRG